MTRTSGFYRRKPKPEQEAKPVPKDEQLGPSKGICLWLPIGIAFWTALYLMVGLANG